MCLLWRGLRMSEGMKEVLVLRNRGMIRRGQSS
jgi:hypothetical protein